MPRDDEEELDFGEEEDEIFSSTASKSRINDLDSVNSSEGRSQKVEAKSRQEDRSVGSRARDDERGRANQGKRIDTRRRSSPILSEPGRAASPQDTRKNAERSPTPPRPPPVRPPHNPRLDANGNSLHPDWESKVSSSGGDIYYKNLKTNKTTWEIPEPVPSPPPPPVERATTPPRKLAVHPDRLKLIPSSALPADSGHVNSTSERQDDNTKGRKRDEGDGQSVPTSATKSPETSRKPLPPQRQVNPLGRVAGRRSRGGGRDHDVPSANATALSSRPTPTGPSADFANGGLNIAGVPTGPRGLVDGTSAPRDAPTGPRSSTAAPPAVASGKWAPASLTTNKWATAPTTAPVSGSNKTAVVSRPTASSEKRTSPKPEQPRWATEPAAANRWARAAPLPSRDSRGRSPPPRAKSPPPAPFRGRESRLALDAKALDESLESYNASRPPGSPDFDREALLRDRNEGRESPTHTNVEERRASTLTDSPKARATSPSVPSRARSRSPPPPATSVRVRSRSPPRRRLSRSPPLAPHPLYRDRPPRSSRRPGAVPVGAVNSIPLPAPSAQSSASFNLWPARAPKGRSPPPPPRERSHSPVRRRSISPRGRPRRSASPPPRRPSPWRGGIRRARSPSPRLRSPSPRRRLSPPRRRRDSLSPRRRSPSPRATDASTRFAPRPSRRAASPALGSSDRWTRGKYRDPDPSPRAPSPPATLDSRPRSPHLPPRPLVAGSNGRSRRAGTPPVQLEPIRFTTSLKKLDLPSTEATSVQAASQAVSLAARISSLPERPVTADEGSGSKRLRDDDRKLLSSDFPERREKRRRGGRR